MDNLPNVRLVNTLTMTMTIELREKRPLDNFSTRTMPKAVVATSTAVLPVKKLVWAFARSAKPAWYASQDTLWETRYWWIDSTIARVGA
jgi:hypothetical protein